MGGGRGLLVVILVLVALLAAACSAAEPPGPAAPTPVAPLSTSPVAAMSPTSLPAAPVAPAASTAAPAAVVGVPPTRLPASAPAPTPRVDSATVSAPTAASPMPTDRSVGAFTLVGQNDLGRRGMNGGLAMAGACAYVGSRDDKGGVVVLDVAAPAQPTIVRELPVRHGSTAREVRASDRLRTLVVMYYGIGSPPVFNGLELYDIADCRAPRLVGEINLGAPPHEFYLWHDPNKPGRALVYLGMFGPTPQMRVVDISDPARPTLYATWEPDAAALRAMPGYQLHSLSLSLDGRRAYLAAWNGGFMLADTSDLAEGKANPTVRLVTPPADHLRLPGGANVHSAVAIPGRDLVVLTSEIYGPCPYGWLHIADIADPARPQLRGEFKIAENDPARCAEVTRAGGTYTAHDPLVLPHIAFVTWYTGGLQAVDLTAPDAPRALAQFRPTPPPVKRPETVLGPGHSFMWSYPILRDGLIYVADITGGLYVVRYTGPHADETQGRAESNAN
ncbi:MAG: hypothetical protein U0768_00045 [Anaerolineae bacterium]